MLYSGVTGKIEIKKGEATAQTVCFATFNVDVTVAILEKPCFGQAWKQKSGKGVKDWTATADGSADFEDDGQKALMDAFLAGDELIYTFYLDSTTFLSGPGILESLSISHDAEGKATMSANVTGAGAMALTVPTVTVPDGEE